MGRKDDIQTEEQNTQVSESTEEQNTQEPQVTIITESQLINYKLDLIMKKVDELIVKLKD
jgi:hypothetical protein